MTIETKFNVFDKVWSIYGNNIIEGKVVTIDIDVFATNESHVIDTTIKYKVNINKYIRPVEVDEDRLFRTKEDLIKSL
jgi:hypothetical protein